MPLWLEIIFGIITAAAAIFGIISTIQSQKNKKDIANFYMQKNNINISSSKTVNNGNSIVQYGNTIINNWHENISNIDRKAENELKDTKVTSNLNECWLGDFFDNAKNCSDDFLQDMWAKILANEIKHPNSTSKKTLNIMKYITKDDAVLFEKVLSYSFNGGVFKNDLLSQKIKLDDILHLTDLGLINSRNDLTWKNEIQSLGQANFFAKEYVVIISNNTASTHYIDIPVYSFTSAGKEISKVSNYLSDLSFLLSSICELKKQYNTLSFKCFKIIGKSENSFQIDNTKDLLENDAHE